MLLKDNEEKRNIAWRTVMTVTSVLIILIVVFFAVKLFTSNPLTGNWENTDAVSYTHLTLPTTPYV